MTLRKDIPIVAYLIAYFIAMILLPLFTLCVMYLQAKILQLIVMLFR